MWLEERDAAFTHGSSRNSAPGFPFPLFFLLGRAVQGSAGNFGPASAAELALAVDICLVYPRLSPPVWSFGGLLIPILRTSLISSETFSHTGKQLSNKVRGLFCRV